MSEKSDDDLPSQPPHDNVLESFKHFRAEILELYLPKEIPLIQEIPEPLVFYRRWVAPNIPVIIKGGIKKWKALKKWNKAYICKKLGSKKITVTVNPNGREDAVADTIINGRAEKLFILPEERLMSMTEFYNKLDNALENPGGSRDIFYIQKKNSNMVEEFPELLPDIDSDLLWASETFQARPSAINFWIGDRRAVTSLHKDIFENLFCVISGSKDFILLPPTDRPWIPYKLLRVGRYNEKSDGELEIINIDDESWKCKVSGSDILASQSSIQNRMSWIGINPEEPDYNKYPLYKYATPIHVKLEEGDILYLPSLWFHHMRQSHGCIGVNFWYEMNLDIKFAYFHLLENLTRHFDE